MKEILEDHSISTVWEGHCDYGPEVQCACEWKGSPDWYTEHLIFMAGETSTAMQDWLDKFSAVGDVRSYQDLFDKPSNVQKRKTAEAKVRKEERRVERLHRMAANGDAEAKKELGLV